MGPVLHHRQVVFTHKKNYNVYIERHFTFAKIFVPCFGQSGAAQSRSGQAAPRHSADCLCWALDCSQYLKNVIKFLIAINA